MGLRNLFKKDKAEKPVVQTQEAVLDKPNAGQPANADAKKKEKHGDSGSCCGSCQ